MKKFLIVILICFTACSHNDQNTLIITDENYKFDISSNKNFKNSVTKHFDNFGISYNSNDIIVFDINKNNYELYKSILQNNIHVDYLSRNPEDIFNLISLTNTDDRKLLLECINAFLRYHAFKPL